MVLGAEVRRSSMDVFVVIPISLVVVVPSNVIVLTIYIVLFARTK